MIANARAEGRRLELFGQVTADNVVGLRRQGEVWLAGQAAHSSAVVELGGVTKTSSLLLSLLLCWQRAAGTRPLELTFSGVPAELLALSRLNGVSRWLTGSP